MMVGLFVAVAFLGSGAFSVCLASSPAATESAECAGWLRGIYGKPTVRRADVLLAALMVREEDGWTTRSGWALGRARETGLLGSGDGADMEGRAARGFGCSVFARALGIRGGLMMRLTGTSGRYAYRELAILGMIPDGPSHLDLSGDELAGLLLAASRYQEVGAERPPEW